MQFVTHLGQSDVVLQKKSKILIVEDDLATRMGLQELLGSAGFDVASAADFLEGRRLLERDEPQLLIVDLRLAGYNGLQLLMRGRMMNPDLQAVVVTGYADQIVQREAVHLRAEHLEKPVDADRLLQVVDNALGRRPSPAPAGSGAAPGSSGYSVAARSDV